MKRIGFYVLLVVLTLCASCKPKIKQVELSTYSLQLKVGEMDIIDVTSHVTSNVIWTSSNTNVATVSDGVVSAVGVGYTTISAKVDNGVGECQVYVVSESGITLSLTPPIVPLRKGDTYQYSYASTYDLPLEWISSNPDVATVDAHGKVTAKTAGNTWITLSNGMESVRSRVAVEHTWGEYKLVWSEEFEGTALNSACWNIEVNGSGGGNKEVQYYTDRNENLRVSDGNLIIEARKEEYNNRQYTSGRINTKGKVAFKYGKIEARIQFPKGGGTWPAFWMMGNDYNQVGWPRCGEIDIIEHVGNQPRMASFAVHTPKKNGMSGNNWSSRSYLDNLEEEYHVYGIEWKEDDYNGMDRIVFTIDGVAYATAQEEADHVDENNYWPFNKEHFIILNLALGGNMGGTVDDAIFANPILMKVDWVRVYQRQEL